MKTQLQKLARALPLPAIVLCLASTATHAQNAQPPDRGSTDKPPADTRRATDLPPSTDPLDPAATDQPALNPPAPHPDRPSTPSVADSTATTPQPAQPSQESTADRAAAAPSNNTIQLASGDATERGLRRFAGQPVLSGEGQRLGTLKDFLIDPASGKITHAITSSGGILGAGNTLRAIPREALQRAPGEEGFMAQIQLEQWSQVPAIDEDEIEAGMLRLSAEQQRQVAQLFGTSVDTATAQREEAQQLQLASAMRGKSIHSGPRQVGDIEDIVIDLDQGIAKALVDPADDFASTDASYLVPIGRLNLVATDEVVTTALSRADFDQAQAQSVVVSAEPAAPAQTPAQPSTGPVEEGPLTPTGRTSAEQTPAADAQLVEAARAVRRALDDNSALATQKVQVTPEGEKLILRGSVPDAQIKANIESTARDAASNAPIENQIRVENAR